MAGLFRDDADAPALLERALRHAEARGCAEVASDLAAAWRLPPRVRGAIRAAGDAADASGQANAYHNPAHTRAVVVAWGVLAALHAALCRASADRRSAAELPSLRARAVAIGLLAALGHDLDHDGRGNVDPRTGGATPFRLENIAAARTAAILNEAGAAGLEPAVTACILATETEGGYGALRDPALRVGRLAPLATPSCWLAAAMLRDADLVSSAGLSEAAFATQAALLSAELGPAGAVPPAIFFGRIAADGFMSPAGRLFNPRFQALRALHVGR